MECIKNASAQMDRSLGPPSPCAVKARSHHGGTLSGIGFGKWLAVLGDDGHGRGAGARAVGGIEGAREHRGSGGARQLVGMLLRGVRKTAPGHAHLEFGPQEMTSDIQVYPV